MIGRNGFYNWSGENQRSEGRDRKFRFPILTLVATNSLETPQDNSTDRLDFEHSSILLIWSTTDWVFSSVCSVTQTDESDFRLYASFRQNSENKGRGCAYNFSIMGHMIPYENYTSDSSLGE